MKGFTEHARARRAVPLRPDGLVIRFPVPYRRLSEHSNPGARGGLNEMEKTTGVLWQRNYYEHIIRNESELNRVREYIADNPARWGEDIYNPDYGDKKCPR